MAVTRYFVVVLLIAGLVVTMEAARQKYNPDNADCTCTEYICNQNPQNYMCDDQNYLGCDENGLCTKKACLPGIRYDLNSRSCQPS
jgi:hypothetical protein